MDIYAEYEKNTSQKLIETYDHILKLYKTNDNIKILDIGGGSGYFSKNLKKYFHANNCEIIVIDSTRYDTWDENFYEIKFMETSAERLTEIFEKNTFDIIFANRVFHHLVKPTWKQSIDNISAIIGKINEILKDNGYFCITDYFYDGRFNHTFASRVIYTLTSCKNPILIAVFKKIEAKSAGVGVCFLSRKMWLHLFSKYNLNLYYSNEGHVLARKKIKLLVYKIVLFIKNCQEDIVMILTKK